MSNLLIPGMGQPMGAAPIQVAAPMNDVQLIAMMTVEILKHKNDSVSMEAAIPYAVGLAGDILAETMKQHRANQQKLAEAVR